MTNDFKSIKNMKSTYFGIDWKCYSKKYLEQCQIKNINCNLLGLSNYDSNYESIYEVKAFNNGVGYRIVNYDDKYQYLEKEEKVEFNFPVGSKYKFITSKGIFYAREAGEWGGEMIIPNNFFNKSYLDQRENLLNISWDDFGENDDLLNKYSENLEFNALHGHLDGNFVEVFEFQDSIYAVDYYDHLISQTRIIKLSSNNKPIEIKLINNENKLYNNISYKGHWIINDTLYFMYNYSDFKSKINETIIATLESDKLIVQYKFDFDIGEVYNFAIYDGCVYAGLSKSILKINLYYGWARIYTNIISSAQEDLLSQYPTNKKKKLHRNKNENRPIFIYNRLTNPCTLKNHKVISLTAKTINIKNDTSINVNLFYCKDCNKFFINKEALMDDYIEKGIILGLNFITQENNDFFLRNESILHYYGYTVKANDLTEKERHKILEWIIINKIIPKNKIISILQHFVSYNGKNEKNRFAKDKWLSDINYVSTYVDDNQNDSQISFYIET